MIGVDSHLDINIGARCAQEGKRKTNTQPLFDLTNAAPATQGWNLEKKGDQKPILLLLLLSKFHSLRFHWSEAGDGRQRKNVIYPFFFFLLNNDSIAFAPGHEYCSSFCTRAAKRQTTIDHLTKVLLRTLRAKVSSEIEITWGKWKKKKQNKNLDHREKPRLEIDSFCCDSDEIHVAYRESTKEKKRKKDSMEGSKAGRFDFKISFSLSLFNKANQSMVGSRKKTLGPVLFKKYFYSGRSCT